MHKLQLVVLFKSAQPGRNYRVIATGLTALAMTGFRNK